MPSWTNIEDRRVAATAFAQRLEADSVLREQCKTNSAIARSTFAEVGEMEDIPETTVFRVFEENDPERDNLAVIILPPAGTPESDFTRFDILGCTSH